MRCGSVGPNNATTGVPTAAATCIGPESLVIKTAACRNKLGSKPTAVCPVRSTAFVRMSAITARASGRSVAAPMNTIGSACACDN